MLRFGSALPNALKGMADNRLIYFFGAMILFFVLFDGIMTYLLPLLMVEHQMSKTMLGIIFSIAAVSGAFFDFAIYKIFKQALYRRLFIAMFAAGFLYIFVVWLAESFIFYAFAVAIWGFYYDLKSFGTLDFVGRHSPKKKIAESFGTIQACQSAGALLAPIIAGALILEFVDWEPFAAAFAFLSISALLFLYLLRKAAKSRQYMPEKEKQHKSFLSEISGWREVGGRILPLLALSSVATIFDAFFISIGPLLAESLPLEPIDGLFMVAYLLPPLLIGNFVGKIALRFGERKSALAGLLIGSSILSTLAFIHNPYAVVLAVFLSSCFTCLMLPMAQSSYAHIIRKDARVKKEIQELGDFAGNFGYIIGPLAAGILADSFGNAAAFSALGIMGVAFALILFFIMPKKAGIKR